MGDDKSTLLALSGGSWARKFGWSRSKQLTSFEGVEAQDGRVTKLLLYGKELTGTIPTELGNLTNLTHLYLYSNQLTGSIPKELGNLTNLVGLDLDDNKLEGSIPSELGQLRKLTTLWLRGNQLTGPIPAPVIGLLGGSLTNLSLRRNAGLTLPEDIGAQAHLTKLDLSGQGITGNIPPELGQLQSLQYLNLENNQLTGGIPPELGQLQNLQCLDLKENHLTGSIPPELGNLTNLTFLSLCDNQLTGSIPIQLGNLTDLTQLVLHWNQLSGSIPKELGNLTNLTHLYLYNNKLEGSIPKELGRLQKLETLWLSRNQLTGRIPPELGQLQKLEGLDLSHNELIDNPGALLGRASMAQWQGTLVSRGQQIAAERLRSEQATKALRRQQEAEQLRISQAAAAAAEAERKRAAQEAAESEARREQEVLRQQELQGQRDEETRRRDTIEPWLRDAGFASGAAAAFARRFKEEHIATPLAIQSLSKDDVVGLARKLEMHDTLVKLLVAALDKAAAVERRRAAEEAEVKARAAAADRQGRVDDAESSSMGQWLRELGFSDEAGHWALELSEQKLYTPDEVVDEVVDEDAATLQLVLDDVKMPSVFRSKLTRGINARAQALKQESARRQQQAEDAAAEEARAQERDRQLREEAARTEALARRASEVEAARTSDLALWLHNEGQFELDLAAALSFRMRVSGVGGRRLLQLMRLEEVQVAMVKKWEVPEDFQGAFLVLWERLRAGPLLAPDQSSASGLRLRSSRYGTLIPLWGGGGQSKVFSAAVLEGVEGTSVFVKRMEAPRQTRMFERECAMLRYLTRKGVVHVPRFEHAETAEPGEDYHFIVMEKGTKNLRQLATDYPRAERGETDWNACVRSWVKQVLRVLRALHSLGVVWADLKPENLVGTALEVPGRNGELMGVDFGSCGVQALTKAAQDLGGNVDVPTTLSEAAGQAFTASYAAPELARCIRDFRECPAHPSVDMWALGMVLFWLVTGRDYFAPPVGLEPPSARAEVIRRDLATEGFEVELGDLPQRQWSTRLLKRLFKVDPELRISAEEAFDDLERILGSVAASKSVAGRSRIVARVEEVAEQQKRLQEEAERSTGAKHDEVMKELQAISAVKDRTIRLIEELVHGELDCPRLFVLAPAKKDLWNVPKRLFGAPMQLHFLCTYGHSSERPCNGGKGFSVLKPKEWITDHAAAWQASMLAVQVVARLAVNVAAPGAAGVLPLDTMMMVLDFKMLGMDPNELADDLDSAVALLGDVGHEDAAWYIDAALCDQLDGGKVDSESPQAQRVREATGEAYRAIVQYLNDRHVGWSSRLGDLRKVCAEADGRVAWVCAAHAQAWRASTPASRRLMQESAPPVLPPRSAGGSAPGTVAPSATLPQPPPPPTPTPKPKKKSKCSVA